MASEKISLVGLPWRRSLGAMQLLQIFDRNGVASLTGGSRFKHHIDWLPLLALQLGLARSGGAQPTELNIVIPVDNQVGPVFWSEAKGMGNDRWFKAVVDRF